MSHRISCSFKLGCHLCTIKSWENAKVAVSCYYSITVRYTKCTKCRHECRFQNFQVTISTLTTRELSIFRHMWLRSCHLMTVIYNQNALHRNIGKWMCFMNNTCSMWYLVVYIGFVTESLTYCFSNFYSVLKVLFFLILSTSLRSLRSILTHWQRQPAVIFSHALFPFPNFYICIVSLIVTMMMMMMMMDLTSSFKTRKKLDASRSAFRWQQAS